MIVYPHYIRNRSQDRRQILFLHSAKRVRDCRQNLMTAGKTYHGCFEMLSWAHCTSANISNICFWLLETCTKYSYFIEENIRPALNGWHLKWSTCISYASHEHAVGRRPVFRQVSRQPSLDVMASWNTGVGGRDVGVQPHPREIRASTNLQNSVTIWYDPYRVASLLFRLSSW